MDSLQLELRAVLTPVDNHDRLISVGPGPDDRLVALWSTESGAGLLSGGETRRGAWFPASVTDRPVSAVVVEYDEGAVRSVVPARDVTVAHPFVQLFPTGEALIVGARCRWRPASPSHPAMKGPEHNALLYDTDGRLLRTGVLGDGIETVRVAPDGRIWVGYTDEGVFGANGWGGSGPSSPIGAPGVVSFDEEFEPVWRLAEEGVADCYALDVERDAVWASTYPGFPFIRIADGRTTRWENDVVNGCRALLVHGDRLAVVGGDLGRAGRVVAGRLDKDRFRGEREFELRLPNGAELEDVLLYGRGRTLHAVRDTEWYVATLEL